MPTPRNRDYSSPPDSFHSMSATYYWSDSAIITGAANPQTGAWVAATSSPNGGSIITYPQSSSVSTSTPSGSHPTGLALLTGQFLSSNTSRKAWFVQNLSVSYPLYVKLGSVGASSGAFNFVLNPANTDGLGGGSYSDSPAVYTGPVSLSGMGKAVIWEI